MRVPHRAHPQDQHAGGRLLRLRAPDAAIRLSAEWAKHPNGARGIVGVTVIAEQPAKWADEVEKYFGPSSVRREGDWIIADTGTQPIRYLTRQD